MYETATAAYACIHVASLQQKFKIDPRRIIRPSAWRLEPCWRLGFAAATVRLSVSYRLHSCSGRQKKDRMKPSTSGSISRVQSFFGSHVSETKDQHTGSGQHMISIS
ncbi:hypothetical protein PAHAL_9G614400 [Panicum hallii]|uniref:Uncharacterized protein n=1 Tax=Panicum hallii TaxID=206008 RepID=A0A2T8I6G3_9POAL|nr:hypothetical protein PAHAL_9G614400 [Panicum hallii]